MSSSNLRPKWKRIKEREWTHISEDWINHIPFIDPVGTKPVPGVAQYQPLLDKIESIENLALNSNIEGLREQILWESIYIFHKAAHIMHAAQRHAKSGMISWSLFSGYHSAYLSAKCLIGLLGVSVPKLNGKQVFIDIFPIANEKKGKDVLGIEGGGDFLYVDIGRQLDQRYMWELLQRVLKMTAFENDKILFLKEAVLELDWSEISSKRNPYIYSSVFWPREDLFDDVTDDEIFVPDTTSGGSWYFVESNQTFLMELSFVLFEICKTLMSDLSKTTPSISREYEYVESEAWVENNTLFGSYLSKLNELFP